MDAEVQIAALQQVCWPAPPQVRAWMSTRRGGVSQAPFDSFNLGMNSGDDPTHVAHNRQQVVATVGAQPLWLQQVHGVDWVYGPAVQRDFQRPVDAPRADASWTDRPGQVLAILSADCLPVLLCDPQGHWVAAAHAGWRGLAAGVLPRLLAALPGRGVDAWAWLGPAIGAASYVVGDEVRDAFLQHNTALAHVFVAHASAQGPRWLADLYAIARFQLEQAGVAGICGGEYCTLSQRELFYSYRGEGRTGRQACLIGLQA